MVGAVGDDPLGADYLSLSGLFVGSGVDVSRIAIARGVSTGVAPIWVDAKGENCIVVVPGANATLTKIAVDEALGALLPRSGGGSGLLVQNEVPLEATMAALVHAAETHTPSFFTPAPAPAGGLPNTALALASVLIPNRGELFALAAEEGGSAGKGADESALSELYARVALLQARGAHSVVVTLGAAGAFVVGACGASALVRPPKVVAVDTSGAGDAFSGSLAFFAAALRAARGAGGGAGSAAAAVQVDFDTLVDAAQRAVCVAALSVTKKGTQRSYARRADLPGTLFDSSRVWGEADVAEFEAWAQQQK